MIYLIDLPGYGTRNIFETHLYKKIMSICNAFIFVVKNSVIKENDTKQILDSMFTQIKKEKNKLSKDFIKSCLFVLNNNNKQPTGEKEIEFAKNDIKEVIKGVDKESINVTFFNAKYYSNYCLNFNYFFNLENLFKMEYDMYAVYQNNMFKYPESFNSKKYKSFGDYMYRKLNDKIKNEEIGNGKIINKNQKINQKVHDEMEDINKNNTFFEEKDYEKYGKNIEKIISYGQENINEIKTLKESNIEKFKKELLNQINYINEEIQEDMTRNIDKVIKMLDLFFLDREEIDSNQEEVFKKKVEENSKNLEILITNSNTYLDSIENDLKKKISNSLEKKKENLEELLKSKNYKEILSEINKEILNDMKDLNQIILSYLEIYNKKSNMLIDEIKKIIGDYSKSKKRKDGNIFKDFKSYFNKKILKKKDKKRDLASELYEDIINSAESLGNILLSSGPINYLKSLVSNYYYLSNIINIIIDTYINRINSTLSLVKTTFNNFIIDTTHLIDLQTYSFFMKFTDQQLERWKELFSFYEKKKEDINRVKAHLAK